MLYPLKMTPYFRHGAQTPWGGRALRDAFGKDIPDETTGESLEISALPGAASVVANGELAGLALDEAFARLGRDLTGLDEEKGFPLLLKLLDANEMLSVQVHPNDEYAGAHHGKRGKSEAWVVLAAPRGAKLVYGLKPLEEPLQKIVAGGGLEGALNWLEVQPGDVLYIPHGLLHALGGGVLVYEIQQASDVTYRFWDWGRVDRAGRPRELHVERALDVARPGLLPGKVAGATLLCAGGSRTAYISDENFELWRLNAAGKMPLEAGRMLFLTPLVPCRLGWPGGEMALNAGESALVPAALAGVYVAGRGPVLMSTTPDAEKLRAQLGYRAENVAGLCP